MGMACTRVVERVCASMGKLSGAPSKFTAALDVPNGGVLWALPALLENGLLRRTRPWFKLPQGYYSLVHLLLLLAFMALQRVKSIEQLRYKPPGELGALLGLDRIPEVRTLREKIKGLCDPEVVSYWSGRLSREWMKSDPQAAGVLYVDGHVRAYHGRQTKLPRRYVARERLCLRGMTDYWVNDQIGRPFFVVSTPLTSGLLGMLREEIVDRLLEDVPNQPSDDALVANPYSHRFVIIFDREGYSPDFFKEMLEYCVACQTYHKFPKSAWPEEEFKDYSVTMPWGYRLRMQLAERGTRLSNGLWVREIRRLNDSGTQTSVLSTDYMADATQIAGHMFARWSQENFFKYMREHYGIDRLIDHSTEPISETAKVVNPAWRRLESKIKTAAGKRSRSLAEFAEISLHEEMESRRVARYESRKGELRERIGELEKELNHAKTRRRKTPRHIEFGDLEEHERFDQLAPTRKQFIDTIRMIAYRAETALALVAREHMARPDDARALVREILTTEADLIPDEKRQTLTVRLHHLTNQMSNRIAQRLADELNATETKYPGTNLRLVFDLVSSGNPRDQEV